MTIEDVRGFALTLPRTTEHLIRDRVRVRVAQIVYAGFSHDETLMGFGFPKELRPELVASEPEKFLMPGESDLRFNWVVCRLAEVDLVEMEDLVFEAWSLCVPKFLVREMALGFSDRERARRSRPLERAAPRTPRSGPRAPSAG